MMIDFALDAERSEGMAPREAIFQASPAALPADHDDDDGGDARRAAADARRGEGSELRQPLGITMVGGLIVSQVLTLFTTPVIYLAFDRLRADAGASQPQRHAAREPRREASVERARRRSTGR